MLLVAIVTGVSGWVGNYITNLSKRDETSMNRINLIIVEYEKSLEQCKDRNAVLVKENRILRQENNELHDKLKGDDK